MNSTNFGYCREVRKEGEVGDVRQSSSCLKVSTTPPILLLERLLSLERRFSCIYTSLGSLCIYMSLGSLCIYMSLGSLCIYMPLGSLCIYMSLGSLCIYTSLGSLCIYTPLGQYRIYMYLYVPREPLQANMACTQ